MTMTHAIPTVMDPDDAAMRQVAAGDTGALAVLFERHKGRLLGYLCRILGDPSTAEDLLGETFLRVYRARERFISGSPFLPWALRIARNLAIAEIRRRTVSLRTWQRLFARSVWEEAPPEPGQGELERRVQAALMRLPEDQRSVVVLKEYLGLAYSDIGRIVGCSEEAARARSYRARASLRRELAGWWEENGGRL